VRVTYLNPVGTIGGAERVLLAALRALPAALPGYAPTVLLLADGPLRAAAEALGARVVVVELPPALAGLGDTQLRGGRARAVVTFTHTALEAAPGLLNFPRRVRAAIAATRPQLLHTNGIKAHLLAALAGPRGVPVLWHVHDFLGERPLVGQLLRRAGGRVRGVVAVSDAVARDAVAVLPTVHVETVRNGLDTDHFSPGPGVDLDALAGLPPVPPGVLRVGLVATYANWKGHGVFLEALARVPGVRGYVVGGPVSTTAGSQVGRGELVARAAALGLRVGFVPFQADPRGVYRALDVVVHASVRPEPFGLTIAEGMSCGRAVVVSAAGGAAELFAEGHDALGHPPGDAAGLAAALRRLAADGALRARLGAAARATAVGRFGLARYGRALAAAYRTVAGRSG
jgi:glycosyltransferase involved in cell wall biosynthesis